MDYVVAALVTAGLISFGAHLIRRRQRREAARARAAAVGADRGLHAPRPGDIVQHGSRDMLVEAVVRLSDATVLWSSCSLDDGGRQRWLLVAADDPGHVLIGEPIDTLQIVGTPSASLDHEDKVYRLARSGRLQVRDGQPAQAAPSAQSWRYWEYVRPGSERLWVFDDGGRWRSYRAQRTPAHLLSLIPAG